MQVGGIGNDLNNHGSSHHVTGCMHDHDVQRKNTGAMRMDSTVARSDAKADKAAEVSQEMSLTDMLRNVVSTGKRIWGHIWGSETGDGGSAVNGTGDGQTVAAAEQTMAQIALNMEEYAAQPGDGQMLDQNTSMTYTPHIAVAATAVQPSQAMIHNNPYFTTANNTGVVKENIFQKIRVKFQDISKQLTKRFTGAFSGRSSSDLRQNSLNSRQQRSKEDMRKHSRYRDKDVEIDCVLTDDSYLLDSYDRKGEYSKLTTDRNDASAGNF